MRIYYFSPYDILRAQVNQICDVRFCEGFAENGCYVELVAPYMIRKNKIKKEDIFNIYGVKKFIRVNILKTPFWDKWPKKIKKIEAFILILFNFFVLVRIFMTNYENLSRIAIVSRSCDLLIPSIMLKKIFRLNSGPKVIYWVHEIKLNKKYIWVYLNSNCIIGTNSNIINDIQKKLNISDNKFIVSFNPITEYQLDNKIDREKALKEIGFQLNHKPLIVYTGKLYVGQEEAIYILKSAIRLPDYYFILTGGKDNVIKYYRNYCKMRNISNVFFTGFVQDASKIKYYQSAADVLISYYTQKDHLVEYNFPQKITEYMLTGNPIVVADHPATRDVLNHSNAIIVKPDDIDSLVVGIKRAVQNKAESLKLGNKAFLDVQELTSKKQAKKLLEFFRKI